MGVYLRLLFTKFHFQASKFPGGSVFLENRPLSHIPCLERPDWILRTLREKNYVEPLRMHGMNPRLINPSSERSDR
jgi:hypothetical protein